MLMLFLIEKSTLLFMYRGYNFEMYSKTIAMYGDEVWQLQTCTVRSHFLIFRLIDERHSFAKSNQMKEQ